MYGGTGGFDLYYVGIKRFKQQKIGEQEGEELQCLVRKWEIVVRAREGDKEQPTKNPANDEFAGFISYEKAY